MFYILKSKPEFGENSVYTDLAKLFRAIRNIPNKDIRTAYSKVIKDEEGNYYPDPNEDSVNKGIFDFFKRHESAFELKALHEKSDSPCYSFENFNSKGKQESWLVLRYPRIYVCFVPDNEDIPNGIAAKSLFSNFKAMAFIDDKMYKDPAV